MGRISLPREKPTQSSNYMDAVASRAIDGNTDGDYEKGSVSHTGANANDPWWEVDLGAEKALNRIAIWARTDAPGLASRLDGFKLSVLDSERNPVWANTYAKAPETNLTIGLDGSRLLTLRNPSATYSQPDFGVDSAIDGNSDEASGWAIAPCLVSGMWRCSKSREETIVEGATLQIRLLQNYPEHAIGKFRIAVTGSDKPVRQHPTDILKLLAKNEPDRSEGERNRLTDYFARFEPALAAKREHLAKLRDELAKVKAPTTVPVLRELEGKKRRKTKIQIRGNFLVTGEEVQPGLPGELHATPEGPIDRMALAQWIVDPENPLTPRVTANRFWEAIFGMGLVRTSEDFGSQGEQPSHPELLDWLATQLVKTDWNVKEFLKLLVTSATYRQSSKVTPELVARDPENRLLARGPRFRLSAEMVRDQALFAAGLLSGKMYGPPVKPPQPSIGLNAAFGSGIDWQTSKGEDKYRRGIYTTWRRSNPYPSMAAFDAPNREVCTVRRDRTNTPLQALVTLNDPVYMEAAQGLARRVVALGEPAEEAIQEAYRICLSRPASPKEVGAVKTLLEKTKRRLKESPDRAAKLATEPIGPAPEGTDIVELASWSVVANVLLNLDEIFLKR